MRSGRRSVRERPPPSSLRAPRGFFLARSKEELRGLVERVLRQFDEYECRRLKGADVSYLLAGKAYEWVTLLKDGMMVLSPREC